jgi:hypothetical protein
MYFQISQQAPDQHTIQWVGLTLLAIVGYFLKKVLSKIEELSDTVGELKTSVAVILDRDRRRRIRDYKDDETTGEKEE